MNEIAGGVMTLLEGGAPPPSQIPPERPPSTFRPDPAWVPYLGDYVSPRGLARLYIDGEKLLAEVVNTPPLVFELEPLRQE